MFRFLRHNRPALTPPPVLYFKDGLAAFGAAGALAEEISGAQRGDLFGDRDIDELVEGRTLGLGQPLGFGLDRRLKP